MSGLQLLFFLFLTVPLVEIYLLIEVGSFIGAPTTIALVVFTAVLGAVLMRAQGFATLGRVQASLARGELPAVEIAEGAVILLAGALLLTPGFVTDIIGLCCLIPPLRRSVIRQIMARHAMRVQDGAGGHRGNVIEGEFHHDDD